MEAGEQDNNGNTALMFACQNLYVELERTLIKLEAGITNKRGETALSIIQKLETD